MKIHVFCDSMKGKDRQILETVMESVGLSDFEISSFLPGQRLRLDAQINIVCSDRHASTDGEELLYLWPSPSTFMSSVDMKREVWSELTKSIRPMAEAISRTERQDRLAGKACVSPMTMDRLLKERDLSSLLEEWERDGTQMMVKDGHGDEIHVFPTKKPGNNEREMTVDELLVVGCALAAFEGSTVSLSRKGDCLELSGSSFAATS